jgi:hypothetical protein
LSEIDEARKMLAVAKQKKQAAIANTANNNGQNVKITSTPPVLPIPITDNLQPISTKIDEILKKLDPAPNTTQSTTEQKIDDILKKLDSTPINTQSVICPAIQSNSNVDIQKIIDTIKSISLNSGSSTTKNTACTVDRVNELEQKFHPYNNIKETYTRLKAAYNLHTAPNNAKALLTEDKTKFESIPTQGMKSTLQKELRDKIGEIDELLDRIEQDPNKGFYSRFYSTKRSEMLKNLRNQKNFTNNDEIKKICEDHECFQSSKTVEITCAALHYAITDEIT